MKHATIAARILSRPLLLEPAYAAVFFSAFGSRSGFASLVDADGVDAPFTQHIESYQVRAQRFSKGVYEPYAIMGDGVAVLSVEGTLVHKTGGLDPDSGMQGYDGLRGKLDMAIADPKVKGVLLNIDSPGGEVAGAFDMADAIRAAGQAKPIWAYAGDTMASAAYLLGSQAQRIYASQTAHVGSIGVLVAHADHSAELENNGVKITLIHSGKHKIDGNPYGALDETVRDRMQADVDEIRDKFAGAVALGRNKDKADILKTEAAMYTAEKAQGVGLVDGVMTLDEVIQAFSQTFARSGGTARGKQMSTIADASPGMLSDAEVEKLMSDAKAEGRAEGVQAERTRIQAILGGEESEGREATARHLAFATSMDAEAANALLATMPRASQAPAAPTLAGYAAGVNLGADVQHEVEVEPPKQISDSEAAAAATQAALDKILGLVK